MTLEKKPSANHNVLELLRGKSYVIAEVYPIVTNGFSDEMVEKNVYAKLSEQGITDLPLVIPCYSEDERIGRIINFLKTQKKSDAIDDPWTIVGFDALGLQEIFKTISQMLIEENPIVQNIDGKKIIILQLNALKHMDPITDKRTGLKIAAIEKGEFAFPTHPTPAS